MMLSKKYRVEYCQELVEHMAKGMSFRSFSAMIGVSYNTLKGWLEHKPGFASAREIGEEARLLFWEKTLISAATGMHKAPQAALVFALKNHFPDEYKDKHEVEHKASVIFIDTGINRSAPAIESSARIVENEQYSALLGKYESNFGKATPIEIDTSRSLYDDENEDASGDASLDQNSTIDETEDEEIASDDWTEL